MESTPIAPVCEFKFWDLFEYLKLINRSSQTSLIYTVYLSMTYSDDRLILRELTDRFEVLKHTVGERETGWQVPLTEFDPWRPRMSFSPPPDHPVEPSLFLAPNTGKITIFYKWVLLHLLLPNYLRIRLKEEEMFWISSWLPDFNAAWFSRWLVNRR